MKKIQGPNDAILIRAQGCLLGQLAGDALGSLVEFQTPEQIRREYPNGVLELADGGLGTRLPANRQTIPRWRCCLPVCWRIRGGMTQGKPERLTCSGWTQGRSIVE
ncbi:ADP-ribosylglycohydrolase family protein [Desulfobulbus alkaliphilus]|nr:ADP-ribosylglycohydrolase family protein [Desulfobulbus alkaliphilus]